MEILSIIPARGGSKGVPRKNIRDLNGKPLIAYTIEQSISSNVVNRTVVSSDDKEILNIAKSLGAEVPFIRPSELAGDSVGDKPVFQHVLNWLKENENYVPDYVLNLRPTCPLRGIEDIKNVAARMIQGKYDSVRSMTAVHGVFHPYWMFKEKDGVAVEFVDGINIKDYYQRQLLPKAYRLNGVVDASTPECIYSDKPIWGGNMGLVEVPEERSHDIDTEDDFKFIEFLIKNNANSR